MQKQEQPTLEGLKQKQWLENIAGMMGAFYF